MKFLFERLTFISIGIALVALAVVGIDAIVLGVLVDSTGHIGGCRWRPEMLPLFDCSSGSPIEQFVGFLLNLPLWLFIYAPLFTIVETMAGYMPTTAITVPRFLLYGADIVLVLSLVHVGRLAGRAIFGKKI
jgi:hypothetical protein